MTCPKCNKEMKCPCIHCRQRNKKNKGIYWIWGNDDLMICGNCGYTAHVDIWQDIDYEQYKKSKK